MLNYLPQLERCPSEASSQDSSEFRVGHQRMTHQIEQEQNCSSRVLEEGRSASLGSYKFGSGDQLKLVSVDDVFTKPIDCEYTVEHGLPPCAGSGTMV